MRTVERMVVVPNAAGRSGVETGSSSATGGSAKDV